jgi:hypothetical protein
MPESVARRNASLCTLDAPAPPPLAAVDKALPAEAPAPAADPRLLRPKTHVDWSTQKLVCPHAKAHGTFPDLDAFCRHIVYECDANSVPAPGLLSPNAHSDSTASIPASPATDEANSNGSMAGAPQFPTGALELTGYLGAVADPEALAERRYAATVTVSPCSRWYTAENTCRLVDFALQASAGPVLVMISDNINSLNEAVKGKPISAATRQQERASRKFQSELELALAARLDEAALARVSFAGFRDWMRQHAAQAAADRDAVLQLYATDDDFARAVDDYCEPWSNKPGRATKHVHRAYAVQYLLEELASLCVPAASGALEMEVYAQSDHFQGWAPREMALAKLFPGRTQRIHAMFSDASLGSK